MPSLRELQEGLAQSLVSGDTARISEWFVSDAFSGERRLQVYSNNLYTSLTDALMGVYPVVARLVGDGFFRYAANQYMAEHPSRSGTCTTSVSSSPHSCAGSDRRKSFATCPTWRDWNGPGMASFTQRTTPPSHWRSSVRPQRNVTGRSASSCALPADSCPPGSQS